MRIRNFPPVLVALVALVALAGFATAEEPKDTRTRQLDNTERAKAVQQFMHLGSTYVSHNLTASGGVRGKPGHFYLEYEYNWKAAGESNSTTISFFFDKNGNLMGTQIDKTTAVFNQPFLLANLSIKLLGQAVLDAQKNATPAEKRDIQRFIDNADAKGLLEFGLALGLAGGK